MRNQIIMGRQKSEFKRNFLRFSRLPDRGDMSVIIRLQNLPWSANALDIRQFFNGLSIPEGGVHIVGGELGDAFIAFR